jgi:hypothetical protein
MYTVFFKGEIDPIQVDDKKAASLRQLLTSASRNDMFDLNGSMYSVGSVKYLQKREEPVPMANPHAEGEAVYLDARMARLRRPIAERAKDMTVFKLMWQAHTGINLKQIPEHLMVAIVARQEGYLREHPDLTYANPICYKDIIDAEPVSDDDRQIAVGARASAMRLVENLLRADRHFRWQNAR